jgi:LuxR family maltose regulon positive regulatory protein
VVTNDADVGAGAAVPEMVLVETKLTPPRVRREHVIRRNLLEALRTGGPRKLTVFTAPPGFGKTTLLAEWAASTDGFAIAWLSLDEDDNDPGRFLAYLLAAIERTVPHVGDRATAALRMPGADHVRSVLPLLVNDLADHGGDVALVLEDYHLITNPDVHGLVAYLVDRSPATLYLVIATREDPPLPLGRLRARGDLVEVRAADLRFTPDESRDFLATLGLDLGTADLERLQGRTEGWPAALYLAAISLRGRADPAGEIERFAGNDRYVVDYLTTEILARQPEAVRSFLLRTSILRRLSGPLCDAVTGRDDSAGQLAELERSNLLLIALDTQRAWFRYHHLFGDLLYHELAATDPGGLADLHRRAFEWYRDAGMIIDAAWHASAAGDLRAAVGLVARHYSWFVDQGQIATVLRWLDALPEAAAAEDWHVGFAGGVVAAHAGRIDSAERWLALAERAPRVARDGEDPEASTAALAGYLRLLRGDIGGAVTFSRRALDSPAAVDPGWALAPQMVLAPALWWAGGAPEAAAIHDAIARAGRAGGIPAAVVYALGNRAAIALDDQDERAASALAKEATDLMRDNGLEEHPWSAMAHIAHGTLLARQGRLVEAEEAIERGVALGERLQAWQVTVCAALVLAEIRQAQHETTSARRQLTRVHDILAALPDPGDGLSRLERTEKALKVRASREHRTTSAPFWELSPRELDVLRLLPSGLSQREIADSLYVSFNTVRTHTRVIFDKLGVNSRPEAVARARELGLLS